MFSEVGIIVRKSFNNAMGMGHHNDKLKVLSILIMNIVSNIDHRLHWLLYAGSERSGEDGLPRGKL